MKILPCIAIATISFWMAGELNAQQPAVEGTNTQQLEGQKTGRQGKAQRGNRRRVQLGQGKQQQQQGKQQGQNGRRGGAQMLDFIFNRFDADKNGMLSQKEAPDRMKQRFDMLDANGDKSVSREEMETAFSRMQGKAGGQGAKGQGGKGKGAKGQAGKGKGAGDKGQAKNAAGKGDRGSRNIDPAQLMQRMDKNNDGQLTADEAPERMKKNFDRIDANSDGKVSTDELKTMFEKMKSGKGGKKQIGRNKSADPNATKPVKPKRPPMADDGA